MAEQTNEENKGTAEPEINEKGNTGLLGAEPQPNAQPEGEGQNNPATPEGQAPEGKAPEETPTEPEITYEAFKLGEGFTVDDEAMTAFTDFAKKHHLTQEEAQSLIDLQTGTAQKNAKANGERFEAEIQKMTDNWEAQVKADAELGGADIMQKMSECRRVCERLGVPEAVEVLQTARMGSNPTILRLLYRASQAIKEDKYVAGSNANGADTSAARTLYPGMN